MGPGSLSKNKNIKYIFIARKRSTPLSFELYMATHTMSQQSLWMFVKFYF
jgi:hypothetical protein